MTSHEAGGEELSKVLEVRDWGLFYQNSVNIVFSWCFVFLFFQVQLYFLNGDWLCEVEFSVECVPGFLLVKGKLYFNSALQSVYFRLGVG